MFKLVGFVGWTATAFVAGMLAMELVNASCDPDWVDQMNRNVHRNMVLCGWAR